MKSGQIKDVVLIISISVGIIMVLNPPIRGSDPDCRRLVGPDAFVDMHDNVDMVFDGGLIMLAGNMEITNPGQLTTWYFVSTVPNGTFWIDTWRPASGDFYQLLNSYEVNVTSSGFNVVRLPSKYRLQLLPGDRFGLHFSENITIRGIALSNETRNNCYAGSVLDLPPAGQQLSVTTLVLTDCAFAIRAGMNTKLMPCGHLYNASSEIDVGKNYSTPIYADTPGVCAYKCLNDETCVSFNFRRAINKEGRRVNVCDINTARAADELANPSDNGNYTDGYHFN